MKKPDRCHELIVAPGEAGLSLELFLQQRLPAAPLAYLRKLIKDGKVRRSTAPATALTAGEQIHLADSRRLLELLQQSEKMAVTILYESEQLLLVDKPAGLATHAGQGHTEDNLTARVTALLRRRGEHFMVAPIQRLDRDTSGVVLFGKGKKSCSLLGTMMMTAPVSKSYLALVAGKLSTDGMVAAAIPAKGKLKTALTRYQVLSGNDTATLLQIELETGRQHQIRRHFALRGHPLYGDRRYHGPCPEGLPRLFLHCCRVSFINPFTQLLLAVAAPVPADLCAFLAASGLSADSCGEI